MIRMTCPCCGTEFPWEAGLIEGDAKRLAVVLADMEPALARAAMAYLRLFKPAKTALRLPRAIKLLQEVRELVLDGSVCRDERTSVRRPAPTSAWIAGIEQMLQQVDRLTLPLNGHGYLRQVVFGVADALDADVERKREEALRAGDRPVAPRNATAPVEDRLTSELRFIAQMYSYGQLTEAERDQKTADARERFGGAA